MTGYAVPTRSCPLGTETVNAVGPMPRLPDEGRKSPPKFGIGELSSREPVARSFRPMLGHIGEPCQPKAWEPGSPWYPQLSISADRLSMSAPHTLVTRVLRKCKSSVAPPKWPIYGAMTYRETAQDSQSRLKRARYLRKRSASLGVFRLSRLTAKSLRPASETVPDSRQTLTTAAS